MLAWLLDEPHDAVAIQHRDAETLGLGHAREEDLRVRPVKFELLHEAADPLEQHVVAEVHHERLPRNELARGQHRVRQPERRFLPDVGHVESPRRSVADGRSDLLGRRADHDPDLGDTRVADRAEHVEEDRRVRDRYQLLRVGVGERAEPGPLSPRKHERSHGQFV